MSIIIKGGASSNLANVDASGNLNVSLAASAPPFDRTVSGSFLGNELLIIGLEGSATIRASIQGTFTGTLFFETTIDGISFFPFILIPYQQTIVNPATSLAGVTQTTVVGNWEGNTGGFSEFRMRGGITGGSAIVTIQAGQAVAVVTSFEVNDGFVDLNNSTVTPLGANAIFTGSSTDVLPFASSKVSIFTDQTSAVNGLMVQFSIDGTNWDYSSAQTITAQAPGFGIALPFARAARFFRIVYTNGATPQGAFRVSVIHQRTTSKEAGSLSNTFNEIMVDHTNTTIGATVKAASTAAVATDTAVVVAISPNNPITLGGAVTVTGDSASGAAKAGNPVQIGGVFNTVQPTVTTGQTVEAQATARGAQIVATGVDAFNTTISGTVTVTQATAANLKVDLSGTAANATAIKVDGSAVTQPVSGTFFQATQPVSGTVTANIGTSGALALDATLTGGTQQSKITDGTNIASVKAASAAAVATDKALVVAVSPNNSVAVTGTFFQATQPVSGTVTSNIGTTGGLALDATLTGGTQQTKITDGTNLATVKAASTAAVAADKALVVAVSTNQGVSLGLTDSKTLVMKTGQLTTAAVTADQVVLTYTVTSGKTFFMEYLRISGNLTTASNNSNNLGNISLESPAGTKLLTEFMVTNTSSSAFTIPFAEALFIPSATVIRVVVTPASATSFVFQASLGGYER